MPPTQPSRRGFIQTAGLIGTGALAARGLADEGDTPLAPPDKQPPDLTVPGAPARKLGWAVVGLGKLALDEVMPAFAKCHLSKPAALVSGHPDKAKRVAAAYGVGEKHLYNYDNYDRLADDPSVEVVYIILPNSLHAEYTIRALKAGKHVLCEKPMAVTTAECEAMIAAAKEAKRKLMIAYRLHYEPFNLKVMELCARKEFGPIRTISATNCQVTKAPNIRLSKELGGGPVGDIGVYCLNATRYITREEPAEVSAFERWPGGATRFREVPESVSFTLRFPSGILAHCDCSFDAFESRRYRVNCAEGFIDMDPAFSYRGLRLHLGHGDRLEQVRLREVDHFAAEMDHFSSCASTGNAPRTPGEEGLADMRVIEAIRRAAESGRTIKVGG